MNLRDRIRELANKNGMSLPNLESELGFGNGTIVRWDKASPTSEKLTKVADYFNVTVDYLLGRGETIDSETPYYLNDEAREMAEELAKNPKLHILFDAARTVSVEDLQFVIDMVNRFKQDSE